MTLEEALRELKRIADREETDPHYRPINAHIDADEVLLELIGDEKIRRAFGTVPKYRP